MKYIILVLLFSCAVPQKPKPQSKGFKYKSKQEKILDCFKFIKRFGTSDVYAGDFCQKVYK